MTLQDIGRDDLVAILAAEVVRIQPRIRLQQIAPDTSLTQDLALDSLDLSALFAFVKAKIADVDLTPWFLVAARRGGDSIGSLAEFVSRACHRAA